MSRAVKVVHLLVRAFVSFLEYALHVRQGTFRRRLGCYG